MDRWYFFGIFGAFTGHSIPFGVDSGTLDGGFYAKFMIKEYLINVNMLYMSLKKRTVIWINQTN